MLITSVCIRKNFEVAKGIFFMERIKSLGLYKRIVLIFLTVIVLVFTLLYSATSKKEGVAYQNKILTPKQENGSTIYAGKIKGEHAVFTVSENKTVEFQYGDKFYGPYVAKEDSSAIPKDPISDSMIGVELYDNNKLIFRGGVVDNDDELWLFNEDGSFDTTSIGFVTTMDGIVTDENGNEIDEMEPTVSMILELMVEPKLTNKGDWITYVEAVLLSVFTAISVLFADEIFRWNLAFQIRNVEQAEPSEWEITSRYIVWTVFPILITILFIVGLQEIN